MKYTYLLSLIKNNKYKLPGRSNNSNSYSLKNAKSKQFKKSL